MVPDIQTVIIPTSRLIWEWECDEDAWIQSPTFSTLLKGPAPLIQLPAYFSGGFCPHLRL